MKELVIIMGTVVLACLIFNMIAGDRNSLKAASGSFMKKTIEMYESSDH